MGLHDELKTVRERVNFYVAEFEQIQEKLERPTTLQVLFPMAYRRAIDHIERKGGVDRRLVMFLGQYFATRQPSLSEYFLGREQRASLEQMRDLLLKVGDAQ
jgi:hypothetical protein